MWPGAWCARICGLRVWTFPWTAAAVLAGVDQGGGALDLCAWESDRIVALNACENCS